MSVWIHRIETIVPEFSFSQEAAGRKMQEWFPDERTRRIVRVLYRQSGIETRHSVVTNFEGKGEDGFFGAGGPLGPEDPRRSPRFPP
jgi:predicted naringenin-chalcone synthase